MKNKENVLSRQKTLSEECIFFKVIKTIQVFMQNLPLFSSEKLIEKDLLITLKTVWNCCIYQHSVGIVFVRNSPKVVFYDFFLEGVVLMKNCMVLVLVVPTSYSRCLACRCRCHHSTLYTLSVLIRHRNCT